MNGVLVRVAAGTYARIVLDRSACWPGSGAAATAFLAQPFTRAGGQGLGKGLTTGE